MTTPQPPLDRPLLGLVGIISGAGKGLGRAFALHAAASGASILVNNRNRIVDDDGRGPADHVVAEIQAAGGDAIAEYSDVTDPDAAQAMVKTALDTWGRLDFVITNAAISRPAMFHKVERDDFEGVLEANILGTTRLAAEAYRVMRAAGSGRVLLIASTAGLHGEPTVTAYATSKGAVVALGKTMAVEGASKGIHTNVLLPYATTPMTDNGMDLEYRDTMRAELVAPVATALIHPNSPINGEVIIAAGGAIRATNAVEWDTVKLPEGNLTPDLLETLVSRSRAGTPHTYTFAHDGFLAFAAEIASTTERSSTS